MENKFTGFSLERPKMNLENKTMQNRKIIFLLLLITLPPFFLSLSQRDFWAPDEPRFAQISKEMIQRGEGVIPYLNNEPNPEKPPLFHWIMIFFSYIGAGGAIKEGVCRLTSAVPGFLGLFMTCYMGKVFFKSREVGLLAALILASNVRYFWLSQFLMIDMSFAFFAFSAILLFKNAHLSSAKITHLLLAYLCLALAVLSKGPLGIVMVFLAFVPYHFWQRYRKKESFFSLTPEFKTLIPWHLLGIVGFTLLSLSWYLAVYFQLGWPFLYENILQQNFARFSGKLGAHVRPFYYYFVNFPPDFLPWIVFLPALVIFLVREIQKDSEEAPVLLWLSSWILFTFFFLSLSKGKYAKYLLPFYPALALLMGYFIWKTALSAADNLTKYGIRLPGLLLGGVLILAALALPGLVYWKAPILFYPALISAGVLLTGGGGVFFFFWKSRYFAASMALATTFLWTALAFGITGFAKLNHFKSGKPFVAMMDKKMDKSLPWCVYGTYRSTFVYYSGRFCVRLDEDAWDVETGEITLEKKIQKFFGENPRSYIITTYGIKNFPLYVQPHCKEIGRHKIGHRNWYLYEFHRHGKNKKEEKDQKKKKGK